MYKVFWSDGSIQEFSKGLTLGQMTRFGKFYKDVRKITQNETEIIFERSAE